MFIYVDIDADKFVTGWGSSPISENSIKVEIEEDNPFLNGNPYLYQLLEGKLVLNDSVLLNNVKSNKIKELDQLCQQEILGKFVFQVNGIDYSFSCDMEAQANFEKVDRAFERQRITEIGWTCYDPEGKVVRVVVDSEIFEQLYVAHLTHIQSNIAKFRDYLQQIVESVTIEASGSVEQAIAEVNSIRW